MTTRTTTMTSRLSRSPARRDRLRTSFSTRRRECTNQLLGPYSCCVVGRSAAPPSRLEPSPVVSALWRIPQLKPRSGRPAERAGRRCQEGVSFARQEAPEDRQGPPACVFCEKELLQPSEDFPAFVGVSLTVGMAYELCKRVLRIFLTHSPSPSPSSRARLRQEGEEG